MALSSLLGVIAMKVVHPGKPGQAVGCDTVSAERGNCPDEHAQECALTPQGQLLLVQRITDQGWTVGSAAGAAGLSERQAYRWLARYRGGGSAALTDRSSAPQHRPHQVPAARVAEIERRRRQRLSGPAIARQLAMPVSTVGGILRRLGLGKLSAHGLPAGTTPPLRNPPQSAGPRQRVLSCLSTIFVEIM